MREDTLKQYNDALQLWLLFRMHVNGKKNKKAEFVLRNARTHFSINDNIWEKAKKESYRIAKKKGVLPTPFFNYYSEVVDSSTKHGRPLR